MALSEDEKIEDRLQTALDALRKAHGELGLAFATLYELYGQETGQLLTILELRREIDELISEINEGWHESISAAKGEK